MADLCAIMVVSGEPEKLYMAYITGIGMAASGLNVYMFFTMNGLKGVTKEGQKIAIPAQKPLGFYSENLVDMGGVELAACSFGMSVMNVSKQELIENVKVSGVTEFAIKSASAKVSLVF
ncbi:MAG: DsrE/DsrF/DrsH-like family protein [Thermoprotei archaeon]